MRPGQQVDAVLGFSWGRAGDDVGGWQELLVFVEADQAVRAAQLPVGMPQRPEPGGECRTPDEAVMRR
jgi:hypothetical protein